MTQATAEAVLLEHKTAGRLPPLAQMPAASPREALKIMHREAALKPGTTNAATRTMDLFQAFRGESGGHVTSGITKRDVTKTASRYMNEGLYGEDLLMALKAKFDVRDLVAAQGELSTVVAEQGLQGIYYVDPTIYDDYGKGCDVVANMFRSKGVPYVKMGSKCGSCVLQSQPGHCSKVNKPLVVEPPYADKVAQQRAVLASGKATTISYENIQSNGLTMLAEYQLQNQPFDVQLDAPRVAEVLDVEFGSAGQGIKIH